MDKKDVNAAFDLVCEEIEGLLNAINREVNEASNAQDYDKVQQISEFAKSVKEFKEKVISLQKEWKTIPKGKPPSQVGKRQGKGKLKRGLKTPQEKYVIPILESLIELDGEAKVKDVLNRVHNKMKGILNEYDYEKLPKTKQIRWENTAMWAKNKMKKEGLLSDDHRKRMWKITDKGKEYYNQHKSQT
ncbi:MAG TPA: winged helix-turn-helix domain-containing protein [Candidatus Hydrogenedens sp.]|nr:winged helix-turn-helix domain-containing protein [Candidatus Hydrogenedens sp.]